MVQLTARHSLVVLVVACSLALGGCARRQAPATGPAPGTATPVAGGPVIPPPPERVEETLPVPADPIAEDAIGDRSLDDLNRNSPFQPVFFGLDSAELDDAGRAAASANAELLKRNPTWAIIIEGHCDERGTTEYNLALGERRAVAVRTYLVSMGISPDRLLTVSYGEEFPFDPGRNEAAWASNRRAHFVITSR